MDAKVNIGNSSKVIQNNLYVRTMSTSFDATSWYIELFGTLPVYEFWVNITRTDEDEDFDIYNVIFNDLVKTGRFTPLVYEYNNARSKKTRDIDTPSYISNHHPIDENTFVSRFYLVSNTEPVVIYYDCDALYIMSHLGTDKINEVFEKYLKKYDQEDNKVKCYVIVKDPDLYLDDFDIKLNGELDFDLYNDGFEDIHNSIVNSIENDENGLYLLYGKPGTGKSTYIRHLIKKCNTDKRRFVYVPSALFGDFTNPGILPFLLRNKGCVFIIEDCENLVTVDDGIRSEGITDLLNMTDGLLADALNIKIICTFNTDYNKIDDALLRPGRCRCKYEFDLLDEEKANKVAKKFGLKQVNKDISLAELFNPEAEVFENKKKKKIGFKVD